MSVGCPSEAHAAARRLDELPSVLGHDVLSPGIGPEDCWAVELSLHPSYESVPDAVLEAVLDTEMSMKHARKRCGAYEIVLVA